VKRPHDLTDQQIALMSVLWDRGEATANEIHQALAQGGGWARGTVGTVLHRLERQHVLAHRAEGREFRYRALVSREDVMAARLDGLVGRLFGGDLAAMVSYAVSKADTRRGDVEKLRKILEAHKARKASS
jgi:predicted transcriptional regulator